MSQHVNIVLLTAILVVICLGRQSSSLFFSCFVTVGCCSLTSLVLKFWNYQNECNRNVNEQAVADLLVTAETEIDYEVEDCIEEVAILGDKSKKTWKPVGVRRGRYIGVLVRNAKAKFSLPRPNEANRMMVRKYIRDLVEEHGVRPSHAAAIIDVATSMVFIPNVYEIFANSMLNTDIVDQRENEYQAKGRHSFLATIFGYMGWIAASKPRTFTGFSTRSGGE